MIPLDLPRGTPIVCVDDDWCGGSLRRGKVYRLGRYQGDFVYILLPDGSDRGGWYHNRFDVVPSPDGADYQGPDDVDLVNGSQADDYPPASIRRAP